MSARSVIERIVQIRVTNERLDGFEHWRGVRLEFIFGYRIVLTVGFKILKGMSEHEFTPWRRDVLLDDKGLPIYCGHRGCGRYAVRIVSYEKPNHPEFQGQTHDCCAAHSRSPRRQQ